MKDIAIIGIGCRFPGGVTDARSYWSLLHEGRCAISEIPADRWSLDGFYDPRPDLTDRSISKWGGFLEDVRGFDPEAFGLSNREAADMDPQQRLLLQVARETAEDARMRVSRLSENSTGVFIGVSNADYGHLHRYRHGDSDRHAGTGTALSIVANRLSHVLDLHGPSLCVDTACSSALVAVDTACRTLQTGACDLAFAGGINILLDPRLFISFSRARMLSPRGRISAFGANADGFVRGEGAGLVLLKRLDEALADGDPVHAVIRATAVNQDGFTDAITAPNEDAQAAMIRTALGRAGASPLDIVLVEAHGTGTAVGDPVEALAIAKVLCEGKRANPLLLGSAKPAIGHLEPAAGIAGLIKAALSLRHGECPPMANFERPNPAIPLQAMGMEVAARPMPLPGARPLALVQAFGFGGTNACAILEAPPVKAARKGTSQPRIDGPTVIPVSGPSDAHMRAHARLLANEMTPHGCLAGLTPSDIAAALAAQRETYPFRTAVIAASAEELRQSLIEVTDGGPEYAAPRELPKVVVAKARPSMRLVFAYTGQGGQFWNMGRGLLDGDEHFNAWLDRFDELFIAEASWSVREALRANECDSRLSDPAVTPAAMFALQAGVTHCLKRIGIVPDMVIGHSFGEVTAAHIAGALPLEAIPRLVSHRGLIRRHIDRRGAMAAIAMGPEELARYLPQDGSIEIGAFNSPGSVTVTGEEASVDVLLAALAQAAPAIRTHKLDLDFAWHSSWLEPVHSRFLVDVGDIPWDTPEIPVISTVTGLPQTRFDADYWWRNLRHPVRFDGAVRHALTLGADTSLEIGPHRTLSSLIGECAADAGRSVTTVAALHRGEDDVRSLACAAARLWCEGRDIEWDTWAEGEGRDIALPPTPWINREFWNEPAEVAQVLRAPERHPLLGTPQDGPTPCWTARISLQALPWLGDHRIGNECLFPAAAYIEMFRAAAVSIFGIQPIELRHLRIHQALALPKIGYVELRTQFSADRNRLSIFTRQQDEAWTLVADALAGAVKWTPDTLPSPLSMPTGAEDPYAEGPAQLRGYGLQFRTLSELRSNDRWLTARVRAAHPPIVTETMTLDPRMVDGCLQSLLLASAEQDSLYLPDRIERIAIAGQLPDGICVQATAQSGASRLRGDVLAGVPGEAASLVIQGLSARRIDGSTAVLARINVGGTFYAEEFITVESSEADVAATAGHWLVVSAPGGQQSARLCSAIANLGAGVSSLIFGVDEFADREMAASAIDCAASGKAVAGIVFACPLDWHVANGTKNLQDIFIEQSWQAIRLAQALDRSAILDAPLWFVTRDARPFGGGAADGACLSQSGLAAIARTIAMERPDRPVHYVDADGDALHDPETVARVLMFGTNNSEYLLRGETVMVPRLRPIGSDTLVPKKISRHRLASEENFAFVQDRPGMMESLCWRSVPDDVLGAGEVRVEIKIAGLNFRDVMSATGMLPPDAESGSGENELGMEFQGIVAACGSDVEAFSPGDRVFGIARGALRHFISLPAARLHRVPEGITDVQAGTTPVAFLTAWHSLNEVARLQPGETVLIHNATGGVGLAAIAVARHLGAQIIATAGSEEKREHLRRLGIKHVHDSRRAGFARNITEQTRGGVDVVLNSLSGDLLVESVACLAPYGRFIELGKRDLHEDASLGLRDLRRNKSFHVVDLAAMLDERPEHISRMMEELNERFASGDLKPLPVTVMGASEAPAAFRLFARAAHIGKLAIDMRDPTVKVIPSPSAGPAFDPESCYLVTGGTSGLGLEVGRWLAAQGAGHVILASRRGDIAIPKNMKALEVVALDVTNAKEVSGLLWRISASGKPLRGIVHAAVEYDDAMIEDMTRRNMERAAGAKVGGAVTLTEAVIDCDARLDFFLSISSLAQITGWPGQANYAAANAFLAALAIRQRAQAIPGHCLNLGLLAGSGFVARNPALAGYLEHSGWRAMPIQMVLDALAVVLRSDAPELTFADADWSRLAAAHPSLGRDGRFSHLLPASGEDKGATASDRYLLRTHATEIVRAALTRVLDMRDRVVAGDINLNDAGLDSLSALELRNAVEAGAGLHVPLGRFTRADTIDDIAALLCALSRESHDPQDLVQGTAQTFSAAESAVANAGNAGTRAAE